MYLHVPAFAGVVLIKVVTALPYAAFMFRSALASYEYRYEDVVRSLGASTYQAVRHVRVPLLATATALAFFLAFLVRWGDYVATLIRRRRPADDAADAALVCSIGHRQRTTHCGPAFGHHRPAGGPAGRARHTGRDSKGAYMSSSLELRTISRSFGTTAVLNNVSLAVDPSAGVALLGASPIRQRRARLQPKPAGECPVHPPGRPDQLSRRPIPAASIAVSTAWAWAL